MASSRDGTAKNFLQKAGKLTSKYAGRAHEKMLQKMGKADEEKDEHINQYVTSFNNQYMTAQKLQREVHRYWEMLKAWNQAQKALMFVATDSYEPEWTRKEELQQSTEHCGLMCDDLLETLKVQMLEQVDYYCGKFADMKTQLSKRDRKLLDYNRAKRELEVLKAKDKINDVKVQKAEESYEEARRLYSDMNRKLHEDLPSFYDGRIPLYSTLFQSFAASHVRFFEETTKLYSSVNDVMEELEGNADQFSIPRDADMSREDLDDSKQSEDRISNGGVPEEGDTTPVGTPAGTPTRKMADTPTLPAEDGQVTVATTPSEPRTPPPPAIVVEGTPDSSPSGEEKSMSLKRPPPPKPVRPKSFMLGEEGDHRGKPPSLSSIVDGIKPPSQAAEKPPADTENQPSVADSSPPEDSDGPLVAAETPEDSDGPPVAAETPEDSDGPPVAADTPEPANTTPPSNDEEPVVDSTAETTTTTTAAATTTLPAAETVVASEEDSPSSEFTPGDGTVKPDEPSEVSADHSSLEAPDTQEPKGQPEAKEEEREEEEGESVQEDKQIGDEEGVKSEDVPSSCSPTLGSHPVESSEHQLEPEQTESEPIQTSDSQSQPAETTEKEPAKSEPEQEEPAKSEPEPEEPAKSEPEQKEPAELEPEPEEPAELEPEPEPKEPAKSEPEQKDPAESEPVSTGSEQPEQAVSAPVPTGSNPSEPVVTNPTPEPPAQTETGDKMEVLYKVLATHSYTREDSDELTLEIDDVIDVLPFPETGEEEQDDGWPMGFQARTGLKGVFPENFTKRII